MAEKRQGYRTVSTPATMAHYASVPFYYSFADDISNYEQVDKLVNDGSNMNHDTLAKYEGEAIFYKTKDGEEKTGSVIALKQDKPYISILEKDAIMTKQGFTSLEWIALSKKIVKRKERIASSQPIVPFEKPLPEIVFSSIIHQLPDIDLCVYTTVNKSWNRLCNSPTSWEACFRSRFNVPADYIPHSKGGWKGEYQEWNEVEKFADSVYIYNTAKDPGQVHTTRYLLHHKKKPINEAAWRYYVTILGCAVESGSLEMVKHLIHYGADVTQRHTREGWTLLFTALRNGQDEIAQYLVEQHGCVVDPAEVENALRILAPSDQVEKFRYVITKAGGAEKLVENPNLYDELLRKAIKSFAVGVVEELATLPVTPRDKDQPLIAETLSSWLEFGWFTIPDITLDVLRILKVLVALGFSKNIAGQAGQTPQQLLEKKLSLISENDGSSVPTEQDREQFLLAKTDPQLEQIKILLASEGGILVFGA